MTNDCVCVCVRNFQGWIEHSERRMKNKKKDDDEDEAAGIPSLP